MINHVNDEGENPTIGETKERVEVPPVKVYLDQCDWSYLQSGKFPETEKTLCRFGEQRRAVIANYSKGPASRRGYRGGNDALGSK